MSAARFDRRNRAGGALQYSTGVYICLLLAACPPDWAYIRIRAHFHFYGRKSFCATELPIG